MSCSPDAINCALLSLECEKNVPVAVVHSTESRFDSCSTNSACLPMNAATCNLSSSSSSLSSSLLTPPSTASRARPFRCVLIDHYDSFTFNLVSLIYSLVGVVPTVLRHDDDWQTICKSIEDVDAIFLSPGPGHPKNEKDFQGSSRILKENARRGVRSIPIFGVCLGLQGMVLLEGGEVIHANEVIHGRTCEIHHSQCGCGQHDAKQLSSSTVLFAGFTQHFPAVRYNSLIADLHRFPHEALKLVGWSVRKSVQLQADKCEAKVECSEEYEVMAIEHRSLPHFAVQFHPESECTPNGAQIVHNFFNFTSNYWRERSSTFPQPTVQMNKAPSLHVADATANEVERNFVLECVEVPFMDSEEVFVRCFASMPFAFWLDSSTLCRSPPLHSHLAKAISSDERFSYMGPGPIPTDLHSHATHSCYQCEHRLPRLVQFEERTRTISTYSHIAKLLEYRVLAPTEDYVTLLSDILQAHAYTIDSTCWASSTLPFPFDCGWTGYFGYEMRHQFQRSEDERWVSAHPTQQKNSIAKTPDSLFLFIDRMIVFDHREKKTFIVVLRPKAHSDPWLNAMRNTLRHLTKHANTNVQPIGNSSANKTANDIPLFADALSAVPHCAAPLHSTTSVASSVDSCAPSCTVEDLSFHWRDDRSSYISLINSCKQFIADGESYELCLTNQLLVDGIRAHPLAIYLQLRNFNPAPYGAYFMVNEWMLSSAISSAASLADTAVVCAESIPAMAIVCSSPERFIRIASGVCESKPIKGTAPRGRSAAEDEAAAQQLAKNEKDRSENLMIVDLIRNDLAHVATAGSVSVPKLMAVESYATVHQLVSTVRANLQEGKQHLDVLRALFPPGSMTGAPKIRSCGLLNALENAPRGIYSGCLGYLAISGNAEFNVVIRTSIAKVQLRKPTLSGSCYSAAGHNLSQADLLGQLNSSVLSCSLAVGAGGAIVHLSTAEEEYAEVELKAKASIHAIQTAHQQATVTTSAICDSACTPVKIVS